MSGAFFGFLDVGQNNAIIVFTIAILFNLLLTTSVRKVLKYDVLDKSRKSKYYNTIIITSVFFMLLGLFINLYFSEFGFVGKGISLGSFLNILSNLGFSWVEYKDNILVLSLTFIGLIVGAYLITRSTKKVRFANPVEQ